MSRCMSLYTQHSQWCFIMSRVVLRVIHNGYSMKPVVLSMKWNGDYSAFSAQNSIKICQNMAWDLISRLASYFENPCHESITYDHFLHWVLWLKGITVSHFDWLLSAHVVVQTCCMHTDVMNGLNHSLTMQCCASTQTMHCITMQLKKITFWWVSSQLNCLMCRYWLFLTVQWCYTQKRPSAKAALKLRQKAMFNDSKLLSRGRCLSANYWQYDVLQSSVYCSNYHILSLNLAYDKKWSVNFILSLHRCQRHVKWTGASRCVGEDACRLKCDSLFLCVHSVFLTAYYTLLAW